MGCEIHDLLSAGGGVITGSEGTAGALKVRAELVRNCEHTAYQPSSTIGLSSYIDSDKTLRVGATADIGSHAFPPLLGVFLSAGPQLHYNFETKKAELGLQGRAFFANPLGVPSIFFSVEAGVLDIDKPDETVSIMLSAVGSVTIFD